MSEEAPRYWIALPADNAGNSPLPHAVIEGHVIQGGTHPDGHWANPAFTALVFTGPPEILQHEGMYTHLYGGFAEVEGPARMLSAEEWMQLARSAGWKESRPR